VDLRIVDASGRTVRAMSGMADAFGALHLRWDGRDTGGRRTQSGLYFVTASTVEGRATHKLAVLE
jgi:flagellar hook assembly protein FlgD